MIAYILGRVMDIDREGIILENNGIGYRIAASEQTMSHFHVGENYKVYTFMNVKEDEVSLFGFYDKDELEFFQLLTKVSTVGPKTALSILSTLDVQGLATAILTNDINSLSSAPGIGKKTASRIVLELVDRVKKMGYLPSGSPEDNEPQITNSENFDIALQALINLGYARNEAEKALDGWDNEMGLEEGIRLALKKLG